MIAIFSISDLPGGAEQVLKQIARHYVSKGIKVRYFIFKKKQSRYYEELDSNLFSITYFNNNILKMVFHFCKNRSLFDRIFSSHVNMNALIGKMIGLKIIKTKHFIARESFSIIYFYKGFKLFKYRLAYYFGYKNIDLLITQTNLMKERLIENLPYLNNRMNIVSIHNPFLFPSTEIQNESIDMGETEFIVSAGRLMPRKGFDILIRAFKNSKKEHPNIKLILLGEGELRKELEDLVEELEMVGEVLLIGFVNNIYPYFKKAKAAVLSSTIEGFPNVLLQMMSQNERVVSTICAGDINNISGLFLAEPNDQESLENALHKALDPIENRDKSNFQFLDYLKERTIEKYMSVIDNNLKGKQL